MTNDSFLGGMAAGCGTLLSIVVLALAVHWFNDLGAAEAAWLAEHLTWPFR